MTRKLSTCPCKFGVLAKQIIDGSRLLSGCAGQSSKRFKCLSIQDFRSSCGSAKCVYGFALLRLHSAGPASSCSGHQQGDPLNCEVGSDAEQSETAVVTPETRFCCVWQGQTAVKWPRRANLLCHKVSCTKPGIGHTSKRFWCLSFKSKRPVNQGRGQ